MKRLALLVAVLSVVAVSAALLLTAASSATTSQANSTSLPTISIAMDGSSITVSGTLQSGAVDVVSTTTGEAEGEPMLVRLDPGVTFAEASAAVAAHKGDPNYLDPYGAIVFDAIAPKGTSNVQTSLQPGDYVAFDTINNDQAKWSHTEFTVTVAAQPATLPAPQGTVSAIEFGFRGQNRLKDGELVRFENDGFLVHMIVWVRVKDTKAAEQATALLRAGKDNAASRLATGFGTFAGPLSSGAFQQLVVNEKPGIYVLLCFMSTQDGREHTRLGMERTIRIVK